MTTEHPTNPRTRLWRLVLPLIAAGAVVATAAGCGGDNGTTSQATVTKSEYVQSVKARCSDYTKERHAAEKPLQQLFKSFHDPSEIPPEQLKAASDQLAALNDTARRVLTDLGNLPRPEGDSATLEQVFANYDDAQAALDEADQAAADGDGAAMAAAFKKFDAALNSNRQAADEFGFSACG